MRGRRRHFQTNGDTVEESRTLDLLKFLGFIFVLFVTLIFAALAALPDHEPQIDIIGQGNLRGEDAAQSHTPNTYTGGGGSVQSVPIIPDAKWPTSVNNKEELEDIIHPGDGDTRMSVPKFWSAPVHNNTLMSRDLAMKIGSCIAADSKGSHVRGSSCPWSERTIFVALTSYRDFQCRDTLNSLFTRARHPERIRVAVVDQTGEHELSCTTPVQPCNRDGSQALCRYKNQIDLYRMMPKLAVGPPFARHIAYRFYRGEYYAMQIDAQTTFVRAWDVDIIEQHEETNDEMAVLSSYPLDIKDSIDEKTGKSLRNTRNVMCNVHYVGEKEHEHYLENDLHSIDGSTDGMPLLNPFWAAAFSFGRGHFAVNVPYDQHQPMVFDAEEMSVGIRGFTVGYDFFAPARNVCFHTYSRGPNKDARENVALFWENESLYKKYDEEMGGKSLRRILGILGMNPGLNVQQWNHVGARVYGVGGVRTTQKFFSVFGIDVNNKNHEHNLCSFVGGGSMHNKFMKFLRKDGMGIDYDKIHYRFKDPDASSTEKQNRS